MTASASAPSVTPSPGQSRYGVLAAHLRERILAGEWAPGQALPAEGALARELGVALGTMRQSLALLVDEGLLERLHGRGTFVRNGLDGASMLRFFRFRPGSQVDATPPLSRILRRRTCAAPAAVATALGLAPKAEVLELLRLREVQGQPGLLERIHLPLPRFDALQAVDPSLWGDLLYPAYQRLCGVTVNKAQDELDFTLLSQEQARWLGLAKGHPAARVTRRAFDLHGHCIECRVTLGDAFSFHYIAQVR